MGYRYRIVSVRHSSRPWAVRFYSRGIRADWNRCARKIRCTDKCGVTGQPAFDCLRLPHLYLNGKRQIVWNIGYRIRKSTVVVIDKNDLLVVERSRHRINRFGIVRCLGRNRQCYFLAVHKTRFWKHSRADSIAFVFFYGHFGGMS